MERNQYHASPSRPKSDSYLKLGNYRNTIYHVIAASSSRKIYKGKKKKEDMAPFDQVSSSFEHITEVSSSRANSNRKNDDADNETLKQQKLRS